MLLTRVLVLVVTSESEVLVYCNRHHGSLTLFRESMTARFGIELFTRRTHSHCVVGPHERRRRGWRRRASVGGSVSQSPIHSAAAAEQGSHRHNHRHAWLGISCLERTLHGI